MMIRLYIIGWSLFLVGCANRTIYYDLTARTTVSNGVGASLLTTSEAALMTWGAFGTSSIWVAYPYLLPDTIVVSWTSEDSVESFHDWQRTVALRPLLPVLDPAKQKYHLQFWFHPGDSLAVKADVVDIGDCRHTQGIGKTRTPHHGPCGVMNDW